MAWPVEGHLWNKNSPNWGYGGLPKNLDEWKQRYTRSIKVLAGLRKGGVSAGVYTQTTDVEVEINGLLGPMTAKTRSMPHGSGPCPRCCSARRMR